MLSIRQQVITEEDVLVSVFASVLFSVLASMFASVLAQFGYRRVVGASLTLIPKTWTVSKGVEECLGVEVCRFVTG